MKLSRIAIGVFAVILARALDGIIGILILIIVAVFLIWLSVAPDDEPPQPDR